MRHILMLPVLAALTGCVSVGSINADTLGIKGNVNTDVGVNQNANTNTNSVQSPGEAAPTAAPTKPPAPASTLAPTAAPTATPTPTSAATAAPTAAPASTPTPTPTPSPWADVAPVLKSVICVRANNRSRVELTFQEPMAIQTNGQLSLLASAANPANYVFAFGKTVSDVSGVDLKGFTPTQVATFASIAPASASDIQRVTFSPSAVTISPNPANPDIIWITASKDADELNDEIAAMKVRVANVQAANGNAIIDTNDTTSNVQTSTI